MIRLPIGPAAEHRIPPPASIGPVRMETVSVRSCMPIIFPFSRRTIPMWHNSWTTAAAAREITQRKGSKYTIAAAHM